MDEISKIQSTEVLISSRFFMILKDLAEGESIILEKTYSSDDLSVLEIDDLAAVWDVTLKREIIERFTYKESEVNDSFGRVSLHFSKNDYSEIGVDIALEDEQLVSKRRFSYEVRITATQNIKSGSLLRI
jgi:hypothetical protein